MRQVVICWTTFKNNVTFILQSSYCDLILRQLYILYNHNHLQLQSTTALACTCLHHHSWVWILCWSRQVPSSRWVGSQRRQRTTRPAARTFQGRASTPLAFPSGRSWQKGWRLQTTRRWKANSGQDWPVQFFFQPLMWNSFCSLMCGVKNEGLELLWLV